MPHLSSHICEHCKKTYYSAAPNSRYCPEQKCQKAKARKWLSNRSTFNKQRRLEYKKMGQTVKLIDNKCIFESAPGEICGDKTGINRYYCPFHFNLINDIGMQAGCSI